MDLRSAAAEAVAKNIRELQIDGVAMSEKIGMHGPRKPSNVALKTDGSKTSSLLVYY